MEQIGISKGERLAVGDACVGRSTVNIFVGTTVFYFHNSSLQRVNCLLSEQV